MEEVNKKNDVLSWSVFIGFMFIGGGVGMLFDQGGTGMIIGLGVGYIVSAIVERTGKK